MTNSGDENFNSEYFKITEAKETLFPKSLGKLHPLQCQAIQLCHTLLIADLAP